MRIYFNFCINCIVIILEMLLNKYKVLIITLNTVKLYDLTLINYKNVFLIFSVKIIIINYSVCICKHIIIAHYK